MLPPTACPMVRDIWPAAGALAAAGFAAVPLQPRPVISVALLVVVAAIVVAVVAVVAGAVAVATVAHTKQQQPANMAKR